MAEKVVVITKHNDDEQYAWKSSAGGSFTVQANHGEPIGWGTKVILHLEEDQTEYLEERRVKEVVKKHSQVIPLPFIWRRNERKKSVMMKQRKKRGRKRRNIKMMRRNPRLKMWAQMKRMIVLRIRKRKHRRLRRNTLITKN